MNIPISSIVLNGYKREKQDARELLASGYNIADRSIPYKALLALLEKTTVGMLDRKVKHGQHLTFEEAFCGMCYVLAATNAHFYQLFHSVLEKACGNGFSKEKSLAMATAFLNLMATKESLSVLTHEEVAGMVSAAMMDTVITLDTHRIIETCGMGGDKGFGKNGSSKKTINASTLSSLVLAALGFPSVKHGSYGNTSAVGSTETIELFGARTSMVSEIQVKEIWDSSGFCFFDAHWCKTIHDLSHLLMMETINHVIGPMTPPVSSRTEINKLMGVNEKIHPETVARAYALLHEKGIQKVGGVIVICGLDEGGLHIDPLDYAAVKKYTAMDEVSPFTTVVATTFHDRYLGIQMIRPEDFGIIIVPEDIQIENSQEFIQKANIEALCGTNPQLADYLAMNAALGLYAIEHLEADSVGIDKRLLPMCFKKCREVIASGKVKSTLVDYVEASGGELLLIEK